MSILSSPQARGSTLGFRGVLYKFEMCFSLLNEITRGRTIWCATLKFKRNTPDLQEKVSATASSTKVTLGLLPELVGGG